LTGERLKDPLPPNHVSGTATISLFDNHVVGCHTNHMDTSGSCLSFSGGPGPCCSGQVAFVDENRPIYGTSMTSATPATTAAPLTGTFEGLTLSSTATCADVISQLP
jgi:hypothetical protein